MKLVLIKHIGLLMILFMVSFDAIASNDTIVAQHITDSLQYHNISITSNHTDSINNSTDSIYDNNYWLRELKRGKIHLDDEKVHYPSVISWGWHTMKKINKLLNNFDTTYVASTGKNFKLTLKNNNWFDDYDYHIGDMTILFHSQMTCNLGAQLSILGISGGYEISTDRLKGRGNKSKKFEISFTCARFSIEYYRMINWGEMTMTYIPDEGERFSLTDFTGLKRKMWGINSYYFFNNRHYSQAAAYGFSKRQLRSVGSLLSGISASHCNFTVRNYYLPDYLKDEDDDFDEDDEDTAFDYTDISLNLGYGYNWAISRRLLLNATGIIYSGVKYAHSKSMSDGGSTFWALNGKFRLGFVYNYGIFFGGVHGYIDGHLFNTGPYRFRRYLYDVSLIAGLQF